MERSAAMTRDWIATARTLSEALPYLQRYDGATIVIKFGGHAMGDEKEMADFARDVVLMKQCNVNPVVVHGGGPMINEMLQRLAIPSEFVDGKRVSDAATVEVVEMVLSGRINKRIVQAINAQGGKAIGLSGKDANLMICEKDIRTTLRDGEEVAVDLGFVGKPVEMHPEILKNFLGSDFIPVVAPVGMGRHGETFNVNGDTAAGAVAAAMKADRLLLLTDVAGVKDASGTVLTELNAAAVRDLTASGVISGGMIPKTQTALEAIEGGVRAVVILDGRAPHAVLLELFTAHGAGTLIRAA
ncbi:MAG TPA: acetylglutamate kinase [Amaricoccus sp.]|uniref:acetylglutamate kinase n=1 Tax=Amaricoccus sp. TaxID=1872485 RepID=UPI002BEAF49C|nr:acetylglutamate kinase [Amaricoccus sp.]HMQ93336.1 acetylglutamate kinase [Amaricoccus sp.]HMR54092.1 acetylglutamate kinase [Amaricoccus sp.]HMR60416.1 acetylglutamate kinase [Amaricoccus sp.]HMU01109.1 acetylglutamate kinase [Amaricoccus sp.]